jgi:hypothetical protein
MTDQASGNTCQQALADACHAFASMRMVVPVDEKEVPRYLGWRMDALAVDVQSSVEVLLSTYGPAQAVVQRLRGVGTREITARELYEELQPQERFMTAFKSVFFFVRAYQDSVASVLFVLLHGPRGRVNKSMNDALKPGNPIGALLDERLPDYRGWFEGWRKNRDKIKYGADFQLSFDGDDNLTLSFLYATEKGTHVDKDQIGLSNVVQGLAMSTQLTVTVLGMVRGGLYRIEWPPPEEPSQ